MDLQEAPVAITPTALGFHVAIIGSVHTNTAWLERELEKVVSAKPREVELDLLRLRFLSSSGVGVLVAFRRGIVNSGGSLRVVAVQKTVFGTLRFAHLDELFKIDPAVVADGEP